MAINEQKAREIAMQVSAYITAHRETERVTRSRIIVPEGVRGRGALSDAKREYHLRRIEFLRTRYGLQWLIDQATGGEAADTLDDDGLTALAKDFERALLCIQDGVSFLDVGLVRAYSDQTA